MKEFIVLICGRGEQEVYLKHLTKKLNVSDYVRFMGYVPHDHISEVYSACDIFVLPSLYESFSLALLEAMSSGKPLVTTKNVGGITYLMDPGENGIIVNPANSEELANAILELIRK